MKYSEINIRDPFILYEDGTYYMYGTRGRHFGQKTGGFDVYTSADLETWSAPQSCFESKAHRLNRCVNWAPEVHKYKGSYYMFATFTAKSGLRGTFALKADDPRGPFVPHSDGPLTPKAWECLDGTLYVDENDVPYLVFCHEHTQIIDGTVEAMQLSPDLKTAVGTPWTLFRGSTPSFVAPKPAGKHYITDGPFLYRTRTGTLLLLWATFLNGNYAECVARSDNGRLDGSFEHLPPLVTDDGGHGMLFFKGEQLYLVFHAPNQSGLERPRLLALTDCGDCLRPV